MIEIDFYILTLILIFVFIFITGFHDEGNLIATIITSRSLNIYFIFILAAVSQFIGTLYLGTKVAVSTVTGLFRLQSFQENTNSSIILFSSILGAIVWNLITWRYKIPSSSSHAIIGGLLGPFVYVYGFSCVNTSGLIFGVLLPLFTSPLIGYGFGYIIFKIIVVIFGKRPVRIKKFFTSFQIFTCVAINAFQGSNDAQKGMGVIALLFMLYNRQNNLSVPFYVIAISAISISLGLFCGGISMIHKVGSKIFGVKTVHSMSAQLSSLVVIIGASLLGFPISGTQIVNSSILGVGSADKPSAVGWNYAKSMLTAWIITLPASSVISLSIYIILSHL